MLPKIIKGGSHVDKRGTVRFINDFDLKSIKRFYQIEHNDTNAVRSWQAHRLENKWFYVVKGSFIFGIVDVDNWVTPSTNLTVNKFILTDSEVKILHIPGGYANGFKALEPNSTVLIFSNASLEESIQDDYRFEENYWQFNTR